MSSAEIQKEIKEHFKNKVSARAQNFIYVRNLKKVWNGAYVVSNHPSSNNMNMFRGLHT